MPFGLKNAGATYQRLVNRIFADLLATNHIDNLREMFLILRRYKMKLNPNKCVFGVDSEKFLGYIVSR